MSKKLGPKWISILFLFIFTIATSYLFFSIKGESYELHGAYWSGSWPVVPYYINAASFPTSVGTQQEIIDAIVSGANHWNFESGANITLVYMGTSTLTSRSSDGTNVIYYDPDECEAPQGNCIGYIQWWPATGSLTDFDITFNGKNDEGDPVTWDATDPVLFAHDLWGVAAHEFGHALGLAHTSSPNYATMNPANYGQGSTYYRFLTYDDINGTQYLYGERNTLSSSAFEVNPGNIVTISLNFPDSPNLSYQFKASTNGTTPGIDMSETDSMDYRTMDLNEPLEDLTDNQYQDYSGTLDSQGVGSMTWDTTGHEGGCMNFAAEIQETSHHWPNDIRHITATIEVCVDSCPEDIDDDGVVGTTDQLAVLAAWGSCSGCDEDIVVNGQVDTNDFLALLAAWGDCE